jgi:hypothetical protein
VRIKWPATNSWLHFILKCILVDGLQFENRLHKGRKFYSRIIEPDFKVLGNCASKSKVTYAKNHKTELPEENITEFQTPCCLSSNGGGNSLLFVASTG